MDISGKVAIVTGGASGLGQATVELYAEKGASVAIFDLNEEAGKAIAERLGVIAATKAEGEMNGLATTLFITMLTLLMKHRFKKQLMLWWKNLVPCTLLIITRVLDLLVKP